MDSPTIEPTHATFQCKNGWAIPSQQEYVCGKIFIHHRSPGGGCPDCHNRNIRTDHFKLIEETESKDKLTAKFACKSCSILFGPDGGFLIGSFNYSVGCAAYPTNIEFAESWITHELEPKDYNSYTHEWQSSSVARPFIIRGNGFEDYAHRGFICKNCFTSIYSRSEFNSSGFVPVRTLKY